MSHQLWCAHCGDQQNKLDGTRIVFERVEPSEDEPGEPAEYERVVWGRARRPDPTERVMYIGRSLHIHPEALPMPLEFYICDGCSARIFPGERCMGWTLWQERQIEPPAWEKGYLE